MDNSGPQKAPPTRSTFRNIQTATISNNFIEIQTESEPRRSCFTCCICCWDRRSCLASSRSLSHVSMAIAVVSALYVIAVSVGLSNFNKITNLHIRQSVIVTCFEGHLDCQNFIPSDSCRFAKNQSACEFELIECYAKKYCAVKPGGVNSFSGKSQLGNCIYDALGIDSDLLYSAPEHENVLEADLWKLLCTNQMKRAKLRDFLREKHFNYDALIVMFSVSVTVFGCAVIGALCCFCASNAKTSLKMPYRVGPAPGQTPSHWKKVQILQRTNQMFKMRTTNWNIQGEGIV